jgi:hypothetical protein
MFKNCADLIHKDCEFVRLDGVVISSEELTNRKNFFKNKIYHQLDGKTVGKTVFIGSNDFAYIIPILSACWELGANVFVHDFHIGFIKIPEFKNFYNFISLIINSDMPVEFFDSTVPSIGVFEYSPIPRAPIVEYQLDQPITANTVAVKTHSSGTTGIPKIIDYSHQMVIELNQNFIDLWGYNTQDLPFHWKTLHHSSLFLNYAIPLLSLCRTHYFAEPRFIAGDNYNPREFFNRVLPAAKQHRMTRILIPYDWIEAMDTADPIDLDETLILYCIKSATKEKMKWIFKHMNPKEIFVGFGCSELGSMFMSRYNKHTVDEYEYNVFTTTAPNLEYRINPVTIDARWRGYPWHTLADIFTEENNRVTFVGRNHSIFLDGEAVPLAPLEKFIGQHFNTKNFQLIGDLSTNLLYLAVFDHDNIPQDLDLVNMLITENLSGKHVLTDIQYFDISSVLAGMKPSNPILLYAFKQKQINGTNSRTH